MSDPLWPDGLRTAGALNVAGGPQSNIDAYQPQIGPAITRRKTTYVVKTYEVELTAIPASERDIFLTFFHTTLKDGNLPFMWVDPMIGANPSTVYQRCKFLPISEDRAYNEARVAPGLFTIGLKVMLL